MFKTVYGKDCGDMFVFSRMQVGTSANSVAVSGRLKYRAGDIGWGIMATRISMVLNDLGVLNREERYI